MDPSNLNIQDHASFVDYWNGISTDRYYNWNQFYTYKSRPFSITPNPYIEDIVGKFQAMFNEGNRDSFEKGLKNFETLYYDKTLCPLRPAFFYSADNFYPFSGLVGIDNVFERPLVYKDPNSSRNIGVEAFAPMSYKPSDVVSVPSRVRHISIINTKTDDDIYL